MKDPEAAVAVVGEASAVGAVGRLWLCHPDWRQAARWRRLSPHLRLVDSTRLGRIREGPAQRAALLAGAGVDAVNLHRRDWSRSLVETFRLFIDGEVPRPPRRDPTTRSWKVLVDKQITDVIDYSCNRFLCPSHPLSPTPNGMSCGSCGIAAR